MTSTRLTLAEMDAEEQAIADDLQAINILMDNSDPQNILQSVIEKLSAEKEQLEKEQKASNEDARLETLLEYISLLQKLHEENEKKPTREQQEYIQELSTDIQEFEKTHPISHSVSAEILKTSRSIARQTEQLKENIIHVLNNIDQLHEELKPMESSFLARQLNAIFSKNDPEKAARAAKLKEHLKTQLAYLGEIYHKDILLLRRQEKFGLTVEWDKVDQKYQKIFAQVEGKISTLQAYKYVTGNKDGFYAQAKEFLHRTKLARDGQKQRAIYLDLLRIQADRIPQKKHRSPFSYQTPAEKREERRKKHR